MLPHGATEGLRRTIQTCKTAAGSAAAAAAAA
eukprot:SAG31_NODE_43101_length_268_cov_1.189349_1_plen_31_part_01